LIWVIVGRRILDRIGQEQTDNVSKAANMSIYAVIRLVGTSLSSWEDAAKGALEEAAKHLEDLRVAEVEQLDIRMQENNVVEYRARLQISFRYHPEKHRAIVWA
jgi:flavin-binding protein dodecin